ILRDFRELNPRIDLELTVAQSSALRGRVESGHLDVALVKVDAGETSGILIRRERMCWSAITALHLEPEQPLPLVIYQAPSLSRNRAVAALERIGRAYRVTCTVRGVNGLLAAARAGLGVAVFTRSLMPEDLVELPAAANLPELGKVDLVLLKSTRAAPERVEALSQAILHSGPPISSRPRARVLR
ncbi:MAG: LysR family transcriptional regulator, partial [Mycobacterium sp.]|nr:LysR family transcriptional regulator [Mycobacterium sp.]